MARVRVLPITDFDGGLNLRDDAFQLGRTESSSLENVDLLPQGGVQRRKCRVAWNAAALSGTPVTGWSYFSDLTAHVVVQVGNSIAWAGSDGVFALVPMVGASGTMRATMAASVASSASGPSPGLSCGYVVRGTGNSAFRYEANVATSPTVTVLADASAAWNDAIDAPVGGTFPRGSCVIEHRGLTWVADTVEGGVSYPTRLRFSHPGQPEDWRTNDYFDIGPGEEGDRIVGLASIGQELLVFKRSSVWQVTGASPDLFRVAPKWEEVGAVSQETISAAEDGVAWFDPARGVFLYSGGETAWLWRKLHDPVLTDGTVSAVNLGQVRLGWLNHRLFCSVPWETATNSRTFVFDPAVGGWTAYTYGCNGFVDWAPPNVVPVRLGLSPSTAYVWDLEGDAGTGDQLTEADTRTSFESFYRTAWFDAGLPAAKKRWRRPQFVLDSDVDTLLRIRSWKDYNYRGTPREFTVNVVSDTVTTTTSVTTQSTYDDHELYDDPSPYDGQVTATVPTGGLVWDEGVWDVGLWSIDDDETGSEAIARSVRGPGVAQAVSLRVMGPDDRHWNLNAIHLKFVPMKVRG